MRVTVPITIDGTNMTTDAASEDYDVWGTDFSEKSYPVLLEKQCKYIVENALNGDLWAVGSGTYIYYKSADSSTFSQVYDLGDLITSIAVNPYTGRVYFASSGLATTSRVYELNTTDYTSTQLAISGDPFVNPKIAVDLYNSNIYVSGQGSTDVYVYDDDAETFTVHASLPYVTGLSIAINSDTKDLYVVVSEYGVYKQTALAGAFALVTDGAVTTWKGVSVNDTSGDVWAYLNTGTGTASTVYKQTAGSGSFVAQLTTTYINDIFSSFGSLSLYLAMSTTTLKLYTSRLFEEGDYCEYGSSIYYALADSHNANPSVDDSKWFRYSATNPLKMFDGSVQSSTTALEEINITLDNSNVTAMAFFNVVAESITVKLTVDTVVVFEETKTLRSTEVTDWYEYFFEPINQIRTALFTDIPAYGSGDFEITLSGTGPTDVVECGLCVAGYLYNVGTTKRNVKPRIVSYSTQTLDDFGRISFVQRSSAKRIEGDVFVESRADFERVIDLYNQIRDLPCLWIASKDADAWSVIYGVYQKFEPNIFNENGTYAFELLEVT